MHQLETLVLGNSFTMYPPLSALGADKRQIGKNDNLITELPQEIIGLRLLKSLYIEANQLLKLPTGFHLMQELDTLDVSFNEQFDLAEALPELAKMQNIKYLNVIGVKADSVTINKIKSSLPKTKLISTLNDVDDEIIVK
jgi:Leucine-rich repeat (LRR) protein